MSHTIQQRSRIVLALAAKDIIDAVKNKTTLTLILGLALMMVTVEALPLLLRLDNRPRLAVYDSDRTALADALRQEGAVQVLELRSAEDVMTAAVESSGPLVGVVLPAGWSAGSGAVVTDGYVSHGLGAAKAASLSAEVETAVTAVTGRPFTLRLQLLYPTLDNGGHGIMVALGLIMAITLITVTLVPYLILEEKTTHTLDALRVSPASVTQVLLGKGLAGMVYGLLAAAVMLAFNLRLVNLWLLLIVAVLAVTLFGVGLGLLVGTLVENEGMVQMWVGLLAVLLIGPMLLVFFGSSRLPVWVSSVLAWLPTTAVFDLVRLSFGSGWPGEVVWPKLTAVALAVGVVFAAAGWRLRTWE